jgi:hypothetical protein
MGLWKVMMAWGCLVAAGAAAADDAVMSELRRQVEELQRQVREMQDKLQSFEAMKKGLAETNEAASDTGKRVEKLEKKVALGSAVSGLKVSGDLRVRYEDRDQDVGMPRTAGKDDDSTEDRGRFRTRARIGLDWASSSEQWQVGMGLASGGSDGRSTNDTWGETDIFETGDIRLDYAYGKFNWTLRDTYPVSLTLGQMKNPYVTTFINWDDDLRPAGLALQVGDPLNKAYGGPFATVGVFDVLWGVNASGSRASNDTDVYMLAGQIGYKYTGEDIDWLVAAGLRGFNATWQDVVIGQFSSVNAYEYDDKDGDGAYDAGEPQLADLNGDGDMTDRVAVRTGSSYNPFQYSSGIYALGDDYDFLIGDLYAEMKTVVAGFEVRPYGHVSYNFGADGVKSQQNLPGAGTAADPEDTDEQMAWLLGLDITRGKWKLGYGYAHIGADSVFGPMKDSDFGETAGLVDTDIQGHKLSLSYNFTKNFTLGVTAYLLDRIDGGSENMPAGQTNDEADSTFCYQADAVWKF